MWATYTNLHTNLYIYIIYIYIYIYIYMREHVWLSLFEYQRNTTISVWLYDKSFVVFVGLTQDLCFAMYMYIYINIYILHI